jgi:SAM-dependent methyltransferase
MTLLRSIKHWFKAKAPMNLTPDIINYASQSYPSNHTFHIGDGTLYPMRKLRKRFNTFSKFYPTPLKSLLDIGCSKGFFVFRAAQTETCERALGIDITTKEIRFCNQVNTYLNATKARFELMELDQLANRIHAFGGPFQTVLVINLYQYLFFGSDHYSGCYLNHDKIFRYLNDVCADRVIFNNRVNLADCQNQSWVLKAKEHSVNYSEKHIFDAASLYFHIKKQGTYGRYPLWVLRKR